MADPLWKKKFEIIKMHGVSDKILDICCNEGDFSSMFINIGHNVVSIDIDRKKLDLARSKNLTTIKYDLNGKVNLPSKSFSTIFALEIVEHLTNPEMERFSCC